MSLSRRADPIRLIAARLGQGELKQIASGPGVSEALRVSIHYHDGRAPNSVATLHRGHTGNCRLLVVYDKAPRPVAFNFEIPLERYRLLLASLRRSRFDSLDDEENVPFFGVDLWLVERMAGSFYHDVVLCPTSARGHHRELVLALREHLPQSIRQGVS
jgi:hypothetical protein